MIQLITGFIVSGPTQFINCLCTNTDSLSVVGAAEKKKMQKHCRHSHSHVSVRGRLKGKTERREIIVLTVKVSGVCSCGCGVVCLPLHVLNDCAHLVEMYPISKKKMCKK